MKKATNKSTRRSHFTSGGGKRTKDGVRAGASPSAGDMRSSSGHGFEPNRDWLKDFLSEMLAVERGGVMFYEKALNELSHEDLRDRLEEFLEETKHHVELCEQMLDAAEGDANEMSPGAKAAQEKAEGLLSVEVPEARLISTISKTWCSPRPRTIGIGRCFPKPRS